MKQFSIKVNGVAYEVEVEETGSINNPSYAAPAVTAAPAVQAAPAASAPAVKAAPVVSQGAVGSEAIKAPMPGTIMAVNVAVGDVVKKGQALCVLEAMKMENEIVAPHDGTVASVNTTKGSSVNAGDLLISLN